MTVQHPEPAVTVPSRLTPLRFRRGRLAVIATAVVVGGTIAAVHTDAAQAAPGAVQAAAPVVLAAATVDSTQMAMTIESNSGPLTGDNGTSFDVTGFHWGATLPATPRGSSISYGALQVQPLVITRPIGVGTPRLLTAIGAGRQLRSVRLTLISNGAEVAQTTYTLSSCLMTDLKHAASAGNAPEEQVTFACRSVVFETRRRNPDGSLGGAIKSELS
jgi:type VI protein secretion system component Hcp